MHVILASAYKYIILRMQLPNGLNLYPEVPLWRVFLLWQARLQPLYQLLKLKGKRISYLKSRTPAKYFCIDLWSLVFLEIYISSITYSCIKRNNKNIVLISVTSATNHKEKGSLSSQEMHENNALRPLPGVKASLKGKYCSIDCEARVDSWKSIMCLYVSGT